MALPNTGGGGTPVLAPHDGGMRWTSPTDLVWLAFALSAGVLLALGAIGLILNYVTQVRENDSKNRLE